MIDSLIVSMDRTKEGDCAAVVSVVTVQANGDELKCTKAFMFSEHEDKFHLLSDFDSQQNPRSTLNYGKDKETAKALFIVSVEKQFIEWLKEVVEAE